MRSNKSYRTSGQRGCKRMFIYKRYSNMSAITQASSKEREC